VEPPVIQISTPEDLEPTGDLLASLGVGLTLVDRGMVVRWANRHVRDVARELTCGSDHCFSALWRKESRCADCLPILVFRTGEPHEGIRERGRPGGPTETWRVRAVPVLDRSGAVAWVAESLVRLTALAPQLGGRLAEESGGAAFVVIDREERIVSWSASATAIFGHTVDQALGRRIDLIVPDQRFEEEREVATRVAVEGRAARFETERRARDGRLVPVALSAVALRDERGVLIGRSCVVEDLSALQQLRGRVAAQEQLLAHITREAADAIAGIDFQGVVTSWNRGAEQLLGVPAAEMVGRPLGAVADAGELARLLERVRRARAVRGQRMTWLDASREPVPVDVSAALLDGPDGAPQGVALVARDLSGQLRLDRQLVRSEKLAVVGSLAAGLAHEIGTPLNVISATAEYLMLDGVENADEQLRGIVAETERISRLVRELLAFARGSSPGRTALRLRDAVERTLRLLRVTCERKHLTVSVEIPPAIPPVHADPDGVHQVLLNLLLNAAAAVADGGRIGVRVRAAGSGPGEAVVLLEVHDDGPGVAPELRERIFDPFFTTRADGTGLGLVVCTRIVADHGGDLRVGEGPLGGASFVVQLPAAPAPLPVPVPLPAEADR
jgi:PAS domain S-box-containing protein